MGLIAKHVDVDILSKLQTWGPADEMMETNFNEVIPNSFNMKLILLSRLEKDPFLGGTEADINKWIFTKTDIVYRMG